MMAAPPRTIAVVELGLLLKYLYPSLEKADETRRFDCLSAVLTG
jgi:hypothetical protein